MDLPGLSIVIIAHNEQSNIGDCLDSLMRVDYPADKLEIIVVDSSYDRTKDIVRGFNRVQLISSERCDFSSKRNLGLAHAKHDLVAFLDADCLAPPQWPAILLPKIGLLDVAAVGCNAYPPPDAPFLGKCIACIGKPAGGAIGFDSEVQFLDRGVNYVGSGCTLYRKTFLDKVGGFDEALRWGDEDVNLSQRLRSAGYVLEYAADAFVYHKTRNSLRQFIPWSYRRGRSRFYAANPPLAKILLDPFSVLWLILLILTVTVLPWRVLLYLIIAAAGLFFVFLYRLIGGRRNGIFPSGSKKFRLLIERRRRIGVGLWTVLIVILPLFCLDRLILHIAQLCCRLPAMSSSTVLAAKRSP
jgi:GT2 family glycosyltransferase